MEMQVNTFINERGDVMFKVQLNQSDGQIVVKTLDYDTYLSILMKSTKKKPYIHLGELPAGYKEAAYMDQDTYKVFLCAPAQKRLMVYRGGHYWIPFPGCLFFLEVNRGAVCTKCVYSYVDEVVGDDTKLYRYPFGNVSENGNICMGNISIKKMKLSESGEFMELFFTGETSDDYYDKRNIKPDYSLTQMIQKLEKMEEFPKGWLVEEDRTYATLKKRIF